MIRRGAVLFYENKNKFSIDWRLTHSYIIATLQLRAVIASGRYAKGMLLDVGCGNKPFLHVFKNKIKRHIGIDLPSTRHINSEIDAFASGDDIPFKDNSFDTILTTSVLEHVKEPQKMFNEMYRVLKKGSYLILTTPCQYGLHEQPYDFFRYTKYGLEMMAKKSKFKVEKIEPLGGMMVIICQLIAKYASISIYALLEILKGKSVDKKEGFNSIKKNVLVQALIFVPQKIFMIMYDIVLKKIDQISAEVDPCLYLMIAKK